MNTNTYLDSGSLIDRAWRKRGEAISEIISEPGKISGRHFKPEQHEYAVSQDLWDTESVKYRPAGTDLWQFFGIPVVLDRNLARNEIVLRWIS